MIQLVLEHNNTSLNFNISNIFIPTIPRFNPDNANMQTRVAALEALFIYRANWEDSVEAAKSRNNAG
ncbi:uncharacterized protein LY89DRAFT_692473 [Mollisia scopiformis]|uniref:Uncharacterized protein n=1 Tax=Mollisia scopiformis TaxID=149040 RepID=A0A132B272_MOLSC|nr:uncharacterized protein LY89DRAFT_692473 [Mollisia scopiformis]KUJ06495.1 hypothetical protein LY89DRAFT_692473 [Mollisia scopiformis]